MDGNEQYTHTFKHNAGEIDQGAITLVFELAKAFERVSLPVVGAWATHVKFPRKVLRLLCGYFEHQRRVQLAVRVFSQKRGEKSLRTSAWQLLHREKTKFALVARFCVQLLRTRGATSPSCLNALLFEKEIACSQKPPRLTVRPSCRLQLTKERTCAIPRCSFRFTGKVSRGPSVHSGRDAESGEEPPTCQLAGGMAKPYIVCFNGFGRYSGTYKSRHHHGRCLRYCPGQPISMVSLFWRRHVARV